MKKSLLLFALLFSINSFGQTKLDSMEIKYQSSIKEIEIIKASLIKGHKEYKIGTMWNIIGAAMVGASFLSNNESIKSAFIGGGSVALLSGAIIHINSHRFQALKAKRIKG